MLDVKIVIGFQLRQTGRKNGATPEDLMESPTRRSNTIVKRVVNVTTIVNLSMESERHMLH